MPPRAAANAYNCYSSENHNLVEGMPFAQRTTQMAAFWFATEPDERAKYDGMAKADRARFVRETAEHENAMDRYEVKLLEAKEAQRQADWRALQAADKARDERLEKDRLHREWKKTQPKLAKKMSAIEQRLSEHNNGMKLYSESGPRMQARSAFIMQHAAVLEPFVLPSIITKESQKTATPGDVQEKVTKTPEWIHGEMRDYQLDGLTWMLQQHRHGVSGILGDEMGLGKTLQTIAFLSTLKYQEKLDGPFLVVCPMSVLSSWMTEFRRWCPSFRTIKLHSSDAAERDRMRKTILPDVSGYDCIVTTYEMVKSTAFNNSLKRIRFRYLVIDEGHVIKNELTQISTTLRKLHYSASMLLTGTPLQNNMHELWALLNFLFPYIFPEGSSVSFDSAFNLTTSNVNDDMLKKCHYMLRPFILRRIKADVEKMVPAKEEIKVFCPLSEMQKFWYKNLLMRETSLLDKSMKDAGAGVEIEETGKTQYQALNNLLMQLRKCCMHPFMFDGAEGSEIELTSKDELVAASGKLQILEKLLAKLKTAGNRVVLFSQFTSMLDILEDFLIKTGYKYCRLDGSTNRVQRTVDISTFNADGSPYFIFLMSTRAGGLGVNLQTADTAILYDSDWNPQADLQAMARVHRIGQKKVVHVYRMVTRGTVEERIIQRAEKKLYLDQMVNRGSTVQADKLEKLGTDALMKMLTFGADKILSADSTAGGGLSDADLDRLIDRKSAAAAGKGSSSGGGTRKAAGAKGKGARAGDKFEEGVKQTAGDFKPELPMMMTQTLQGQTYEKKSMEDLSKEWERISGTKRARKTTGTKIGQDFVLHANNYEMGHNISVYDQEQKGKMVMGTEHKRKNQIAGRDYSNEEHCMICWDGGDLVLCDGCPAAYHEKCLGSFQGFSEGDKKPWNVSFGTWHCPQHECDECGRRSAQVGGMLFRCSHCPKAFCEDHLPLDANIMKTCERFQKLGQRHPKQACFILCSDLCSHFAASAVGGNGAQKGQKAAAAVGAAANTKFGANALVLQAAATSATASGQSAAAAPGTLASGKKQRKKSPPKPSPIRPASAAASGGASAEGALFSPAISPFESPKDGASPKCSTAKRMSMSAAKPSPAKKAKMQPPLAASLPIGSAMPTVGWKVEVEFADLGKYVGKVTEVSPVKKQGSPKKRHFTVYFDVDDVSTVCRCYVWFPELRL